MALEIPAYNLFMMCESLQREAFAPLPAGYSVRLCREDELEIWMALNAESPESFPFLQDYYQRVYQNKGKLFVSFSPSSQRLCPLQSLLRFYSGNTPRTANDE